MVIVDHSYDECLRTEILTSASSTYTLLFQSILRIVTLLERYVLLICLQNTQEVMESIVRKAEN